MLPSEAGKNEIENLGEQYLHDGYVGRSDADKRHYFSVSHEVGKTDEENETGKDETYFPEQSDKQGKQRQSNKNASPEKTGQRILIAESLHKDARTAQHPDTKNYTGKKRRSHGKFLGHHLVGTVKGMKEKG